MSRLTSSEIHRLQTLLTTQTPSAIMLQQLPVVAAALAAMALLAGLSPSVTSLLEYDRQAVAAGEHFRLVTGHLVHWSYDHLLWDVVMFAALAAFLERTSRRLLVATLAVSTAAISLALWMFAPEVNVYRGLSGIDSALFATALGVVFFESLRAKHRVSLWVVGALGGGFIAKVAFEAVTGTTLFVDSSASAFVPLPLVHAVGAAAGLLTVGVAIRAMPAH